MRYFCFRHIKGAGRKFKDLQNLKKNVKREGNMEDTWREYWRWENMSLAQMYNVMKYMLYFDVEEGGTNNRYSIWPTN